jgi:hypothetical protein
MHERGLVHRIPWTVTRPLKTRELVRGTHPALVRPMNTRTHYVLRLLATAAIATAYFFPHS